MTYIRPMNVCRAIDGSASILKKSLSLSSSGCPHPQDQSVLWRSLISSNSPRD